MVISGDWQKNPRLQPTCGWARRCQTKHSAQRFSREDLSPVPLRCFPVGVLSPAPALHPPAQPRSPHTQACAFIGDEHSGLKTTWLEGIK